MQESTASRTAYRVALRRAAHQLWDTPRVFDDPLALRILGLAGADAKMLAGSDLRAPARPSSASLRAYLVARSRFAEDVLHAAVQHGNVQQYVLLGAGLDTFAYRNSYQRLRVFEVDHPATQAWKLSLLRATGIAIPETVRHVAVNLQIDSLEERLAAAEFDRSKPAVFAWLGVVPYLSEEAFTATLRFISGCTETSELVLDYGLPRHALPPDEQLAFDSLAARVTAAGEPFLLFFAPAALRYRLACEGWHVMEDLDRDAINARYFEKRTDHLRCMGNGGHLLHAVLRRHGKLV